MASAQLIEVRIWKNSASREFKYEVQRKERGLDQE